MERLLKANGEYKISISLEMHTRGYACMDALEGSNALTTISYWESETVKAGRYRAILLYYAWYAWHEPGLNMLKYAYC